MRQSVSSQESLTISNEHFKIIKLLGKGSYGKAFVAKCLISSQLDSTGAESLRVKFKPDKKV